MKKVVLFVLLLLLLIGTTAAEEKASELSLSISLNTSTADVSKQQGITASLTAQGGTGKYTYGFNWCVRQGENTQQMQIVFDQVEASNSFIPSYGEAGYVEAWVEDSDGNQASASASFTIVGAKPPMEVNLHMASSVQAGTQLLAEWTVINAAESWRVYWAGWEVLEGDVRVAYYEQFPQANEASLTPRFGDQGVFCLGIVDANGEAVYQETPFAITDAPAAITIDISMPAIAQVGTPYSISWVVNGGVGTSSVDSIRCELYDGDDFLQTVYPEVHNDTVVLEILAGTRGILYLQISDDLGRTQYIEKEFSVKGDVGAPLTVEVEMPKTVNVGSPIEVVWTASGGQAPYSVDMDWASWSVYEVGETVSSGFVTPMDNNRTTFTPLFGSRVTLSFTVLDAAGRRTQVERQIAITGASASPLSMQINIPSSVRVGETITANWSISGGTAPYTVSWAIWVLYDEVGVPTDIDAECSKNTSSFTPLYSTEGYLEIAVEDNLGRSTSQKAAFSVTDSTAASPLSLDISMSALSVEINESITADCKVTGGTGPYSLNASMTLYDGDSPIVIVEAQIEGLKAIFTPPGGTGARLWIEAHDALGRTVSREITVRLINPLILQVELSSNQVQAGQAITASWSLSGGVEPYTFGYLGWELYQGDKFLRSYSMIDSVSNCKLTPEFGDRGVFLMGVMDAKGRIREYEQAFTIQGGRIIDLDVKIVLSHDKVESGQTVDASWTVSGGVPPYELVQAYWQYVKANDCTRYIEFTDPAAGTSSSTVPEGAVEGLFHVMMADKDGIVCAAQKSFTAQNAAASIPGDANSDNAIDILDLVSIIDHIVSNTSPASLSNADANGDGTVDILDLVWIIDRIVGG